MTQPLVTSTNVAIIGASLAGLRTAQSLRIHGYDGGVTVVGDEFEMPYDRPPLSKDVLVGARSVSEVSLVVPGGLEALDVTWLLGRRATSLDVHGKSIRLDDGRAVSFDSAVVATGARPRRMSLPNASAAGVHVLRSLADCQALSVDLLPARHVVVIGAGFIGCEVAASCTKRGLNVALLDRGRVPLQALGIEPGLAIREVLVDHGVNFRANAMVTGLLQSDGRVTAVELASGEVIAADVVVVAIGVVPNVEWLHGSGLSVADGVLCDAKGQAAPDVYAAGDVARWDHGVFGPLRVEHWSTAVEQGMYLGRRIATRRADDVEPFAGIPFFWSDIFDTNLQFVGALAPDNICYLVPDLPDGQMLVLYEWAGVVVAALGLRCASTVLRLRSLMGTASREEVLARADKSPYGTVATTSSRIADRA